MSMAHIVYIASISERVHIFGYIVAFLYLGASWFLFMTVAIDDSGSTIGDLETIVPCNIPNEYCANSEVILGNAIFSKAPRTEEF